MSFQTSGTSSRLERAANSTNGTIDVSRLRAYCSRRWLVSDRVRSLFPICIGIRSAETPVPVSLTVAVLIFAGTLRNAG